MDALAACGTQVEGPTALRQGERRSRDSALFLLVSLHGTLEVGYTGALY